MKGIMQGFNDRMLNRLQVSFTLGTPLLLAACADTGGSLRAMAETSGLVKGALILFGLLFLLAGYRIHQFMIQLAGFAFGGVLGSIAAGMFFQDGNWLAGGLGFVIGGLLGAGIALFLAELGVFLIGAAAGGMLGASLAGGFDAESSTMLIIAGVLAVLGGILMLALYKGWIIGVTSLLGAILLGIGTGTGIFPMILFFLVGLAVQYGLSRKKKG